MDDGAPPDEPAHRHLRPSGGYAGLRAYQVATLIHDATVLFCDRFVPVASRTHDQMVQAARSGKQNIAEGSCASATSAKSEIFLTNVARGSQVELRLDYEDYLRQKKLRFWEKNDPETLAVRRLGKAIPSDPSDRSDLSDLTEKGDRARWALYASWLEHRDPEVVANTLRCLIFQATYLMDQLIAVLERKLIDEGGYSEQLFAARSAARPSKRPDRSGPPKPACPLCGQPMALRTARNGKNPGSRFWGCTAYPGCKGTRDTA